MNKQRGIIIAASIILILCGHRSAVWADHSGDLLKAVSKGDIAGVRALLDRGADIDAMDGGGRTALVLSISRGHTALAKFLIERGANINAKGYDGFCPVYAAVQKNNAAVALLLLAKGADPNAVLTDDYPVLFVAIRNNNESIVRELVARGADVNVTSMAGTGYGPEGKPETPLIFARKRGNRKIINSLIKAGAK